jgi:hypothetical protein
MAKWNQLPKNTKLRFIEDDELYVIKEADKKNMVRVVNLNDKKDWFDCVGNTHINDNWVLTVVDG